MQRTNAFVIGIFNHQSDEFVLFAFIFNSGQIVLFFDRLLTVQANNVLLYMTLLSKEGGFDIKVLFVVY
jgi:hypothetical protein